MVWDGLDLADVTLQVTRDVLGSAVSYTPTSTGVAVPLTGIWDRDHVSVQTEGELDVVSTGPMLAVRIADLPVAPAKGDTFVVAGVSYRVHRVATDGQGGAELHGRVAP